MPDPKSEVTTFGNKATREAPDGTMYVGFIPTITAPHGLAQPHRSLDFSPVLLPEATLRELLDEQRKKNRPLVLLGQVIIQVEQPEPPVADETPKSS